MTMKIFVSGDKNKKIIQHECELVNCLFDGNLKIRL